MKSKCEGCYTEPVVDCVSIRVTNGVLTLCRQCLDDVNRKNPQLVAATDLLKSLQNPDMPSGLIEGIEYLIRHGSEGWAQVAKLRTEQLREREEWNQFAGVRHPPGSPSLTPADARLMRAIFEPVDDTGPDEP